MTDIHIHLPPYIVNLRAAAILRNNDNVLLCKLTHDYWFLPGGRIQTGESSESALRRELREEIGQTFTIDRLAVVAENFFRLDHQLVHEFCFFYEARWTGPRSLRPPAGARETLRWFNLPELATVQLKPDFIKPHIVRPATSLRHLIHVDASFIPD